MGAEKAEAHRDVFERISNQIITEADFRNFVQMMIDVYEAGYLKSYNDCREEFERHGINVVVSSEIK